MIQKRLRRERRAALASDTLAPKAAARATATPCR